MFSRIGYESPPTTMRRTTIESYCFIQAIKEIDDKKFEHGDGGIDDCYIKVTAICRYDGEAREKLSFEKLKENGLNPNLKSIRGSFRPQGELLKYINSIKSSVKYVD